MTVPRIACTHLAGADHLPLLVVGPSLGTSVAALWTSAAQLLGETHCVVGWDLPGHGASVSLRAPFTIADVGKAVAATIESEWGAGTFAYAGVSIGGAVGLHLLLDAPSRVSAAALICTGAVIGAAADWRARAQRVRSEGTAAMLQMARQRWFAPGFDEREPQRVTALLESLRNADAESYAMCCEALAEFDVRDRLARIKVPVLAIAGSCDVATPPKSLLELGTRVRDGTFIELPCAAHLPPAERPRRIAQLVTSLLERAPR
ncbi:alpha/beta fold hydrolase [Mycobacterium sp. 1465703.0]|uniref:alpha/beta fold hydrolase n=1 Tax=Mycobacterium sp. 1465703.0 TaxID=1834078 RepID=UPI0008019AC2|nr:alpha/beta fold hydrolase [Mycobacterium sp. 1465703.0]OBJ08840.1 hypothetical protein A5625_14125 [Mycobacterium sp. 1465703.0]